MMARIREVTGQKVIYLKFEMKDFADNWMDDMWKREEIGKAPRFGPNN